MLGLLRGPSIWKQIMPIQTTAVKFTRTGVPEDVVEVSRMELADLRPNQVLVRMQAAPINPADLNMLEGRYAVQPELPAVAGMEGIGVVAKKGVGVSGLREGQQVIAPLRTGSWCEAYITEGTNVIPVPPGMPVDQAAMLAINPPTAWHLLHRFVRLHPGDWLIQNAANSGVGRCVIQIAAAKGLRTVSIVRRAELVDELRSLGGDVVVVDGPQLRDEVREATGGAPIRLGLNATCGPILKRMLPCVADGGTVVTYGAMAREPFILSNAHLIFRDITARGFWITGWYRNATELEVQELFAALCPMLKAGSIYCPVEARYPLFQSRDAILHASREGRSGKILFEMG